MCGPGRALLLLLALAVGFGGASSQSCAPNKTCTLPSGKSGCIQDNDELYTCNNIIAGTGKGYPDQLRTGRGPWCHGDDPTKEAWNKKHEDGCAACRAYADHVRTFCAKEGNGNKLGCDSCGGEKESKGSLLAAIGILMTVGACFVSNLGTNLQKVSMNRDSERPAAQRKTVFKQPLWVMGTVCMIAGSVADFVALGFAPQSLLAPLATFTLVFNVFIAQYVNKETPTTTNIIATGVILSATFCIVYFGDRDTKCYQLQELICGFSDSWTLLYLGVVFVFMALAGYKSWVLDREADAAAVPMSERRNVALWMAPFGGVCGGNTFLFAKAVAELVKAQARGETGIISPVSLLLVALLVGNLLLQVRFLNEALRRFDILLIVPVYQTFWILSGTLAGLIYFKEYVEISESPARVLMFFAGVCGAISGVAMLAQGTRAAAIQRKSVLLSDEERAASDSDTEHTGLMRNTHTGVRPSQRDSVVDAFAKYMARSSHHYGQSNGEEGSMRNVWAEWGGTGYIRQSASLGSLQKVSSNGGGGAISPGR